MSDDKKKTIPIVSNKDSGDDDLYRKSSLVDNDDFDWNCEFADYLNAKTKRALERIHDPKKKDDNGIDK